MPAAWTKPSLPDPSNAPSVLKLISATEVLNQWHYLRKCLVETEGLLRVLNVPIPEPPPAPRPPADPRSSLGRAKFVHKAVEAMRGTVFSAEGVLAHIQARYNVVLTNKSISGHLRVMRSKGKLMVDQHPNPKEGLLTFYRHPDVLPNPPDLPLSLKPAPFCDPFVMQG
jgi:hypothetical protein